MTTRVVFDTNVALAVLVFADPELRALAARWNAAELEAVADDDTLAEFERVLGYPELKLDANDVTRLAADYRRRCTLIPMASVSASSLPRCRDPDDQKFLQLAQRAKADWLLTRDKALLRLHRTPGCRIVKPELLNGDGSIAASRAG